MGCSFCFKKMNDVSKTIYCPKCGRRIIEYTYDELKSEPRKCKNCNLMVVYDALTDMTITFPVPSRNTNSGKRFW